MGDKRPAVTVCGNCGAQLLGLFCHACGQKAVHAEIRLHDFFHEAFDEFLHFDGKIFETLRVLLTKPGMLTSEFLSGRRARYLSPVRLYLTCSLLFFVLAAITPDLTRSVIKVTYTRSPGDAPMTPAEEQQLRDEYSARMGRAIIHDFPRVMFALMPAFGKLTWVFYREARPFYVAHLYYSIHFHAFAFLALTFLIPLHLVGGRYGPQAARLVPVAIMVYHYASLRRVFDGSRLQTAWKGTLLWIIYVLVVITVMIVIGLRSIKVNH